VGGQSEASIKAAQDAGFENLTIDLIYGVPTATRAHWIENVQKAIDLGVPHLSSYALTVEEKTALAYQIKTQKIQPLDEEEAHQQFLLLTQMATAAGFEHYEISNLAKPGYRAVHNSQYWHGVPYLGVGPSAHSYDGKNRRWNRANNVLYSKAVLSGEKYWEGETLTEADRYNETIMTRLRLLEGLPKNYVEIHFSEPFQNHLVAELKAELAAGRIVDNGAHYAISPEHRFSADGIAANLFYL
jgi:oxygen-independent coproporphyrinogen-3 oxidase